MAARANSPETKAEKRMRAMTRMRTNAKRTSEKTAKDVARLGRVMAKAILERGEVTVRDSEAAGFTEAEFRRLFPAAIAYARKFDPRIVNMEAGFED